VCEINLNYFWRKFEKIYSPADMTILSLMWRKRAVLLSFLLTFCTLSGISFATDAPKGNATEGAKLFKQNCAVCHRLDDQKLTGPGLAGVTTRVPQPYEAWMLKWIKNNIALQKSGDAYANKVAGDNNHVAMTVFDGTLSDEQIQDIIAYVANPPKEVAAATTGGGSTTGGASNAGSNNSLDTIWVLLISIAFLLIVLLVLRSVRKSLQAVANEKKGIPIPVDRSMWGDLTHWIFTHKFYFACINVFIFALFVVYGWEYLWGIDVTAGYHPSQPINFSHQVHAGTNGINCIYCHSGAEKGKVAGIPTLNVCMNCHKGINGSENPEYQKEIAKVYDAVGWDPAKADYTKPSHPVKWNRVHALEDFVYFNHSQHVSVGKIECQRCHGDVAKFTTDQQFAELTMGWCVNCHRETPVHMQGNAYYDKIHAALMKKDSSLHPTEADMGGLECGKCHY
jgi:mono/diheme cytochrome c family protein